jgi:hypothetical protein
MRKVSGTLVESAFSYTFYPESNNIAVICILGMGNTGAPLFPLLPWILTNQSTKTQSMNVRKRGSGITSETTRKTGSATLSDDEEELLAPAERLARSEAGTTDYGPALSDLDDGVGGVAPGVSDLVAKGEARAGIPSARHEAAAAGAAPEHGEERQLPTRHKRDCFANN